MESLGQKIRAIDMNAAGDETIQELTDCLELYSSYGLTPFHIDCAKNSLICEYEVDLESADVNAAVSAESPFWPGVTPLLIAAKFGNVFLVKRLLDLGADPAARDSGGNTPLHYLVMPPEGYNLKLYDERLFALDGRDTFGSYNGQSHFHIACRSCPQALDIVKRYLDQGVSPDLPLQISGRSGNYNFNGLRKVGIHIAADRACAALMKLLLEYGAAMDTNDFYVGTTIGNLRFPQNYYDINHALAECVCTLMEIGWNQNRCEVFVMLKYIPHSTDETKRVFSRCVKRLLLINCNLVSKKVMKTYLKLLKDERDKWQKTDYTVRCLDELKALTDLKLRQILDGSIIVKSDFKKKFGRLDFVNFELYPIYGSLLRIKVKRKLIDFENKERTIWQAVPKLQQLFQSLCQIPHVCAEMILWNLTDKELARFALAQL